MTGSATTLEHPLGLPLPLTGATRVYAIVGDPIVQAGSPGLFNQAFRRLGSQSCLIPMHVAPEQLPALVACFRATRNWDGLIVTVPHKVAIIDCIDDVGPAAQRTGAVNAIRKVDGRLVGDNFDGLGFLQGLRTRQHDVRGRRVLLVGAGGAGRAVLDALADAGIAAADVFDIDAARAAALASAVAATSGVPVAPTDRPAVDGHDLVVHCAPSTGVVPVCLDGAVSHTLVVDIGLSPIPTPLLADASARGLQTHDGIHMLTGQVEAVLAFFGVAPGP